MDYQTLIIFVLFAVGLALIVAEIFIPSGGFIAILSILSFVASVVYAHRVWWASNRDAFWIFCGSTLVLIPVTVVGTFWVLSRTRLGNHVLLEGPSQDEVDPYAADADKRMRLIGQVGEAVTLMAPGGLVAVDGERYHAVAQGGMIDPGEPVLVIAVQGHRVMVRQQLPEEIEARTTESTLDDSPDNNGTELGVSDRLNNQLAERQPPEHSLDFDIPD